MQTPLRLALRLAHDTASRLAPRLAPSLAHGFALTLTIVLGLTVAGTGRAEIYDETQLPDHLRPFEEMGRFYESHPELRSTPSSGWKPFQRALWLAQTRPVGPNGSAAEARRDAARRIAETKAPVGERGANGWFSAGPVHLSGRCVSMDYDPTDADVVYVGSAGGGLWKSTNGGDEWTAMTDDFSTLAVGAVCVLGWNSDVVLMGTGEGTMAGLGALGSGLFRSTDGGETWQATSLSYPTNSFHGFNAIEDNPTTQTILAAASDGLYRSADEGVTWTLVEGAGNFFDIKWKPGDAETVYVTKGRDTTGNNQNDNGVKISVDNGLTFSLAGTGQPVGSSIGKTKIAVSADDPEVIYAHYANTANWQTLGIFRSTDGGNTWDLRNGSINMTGAQGWYNLVLSADPDDAEVIVTGGVNLYRSTDGGLTYTNLNPGIGFGNDVLPHWDHHALVYEPNSTNNLWVATDGGVWKSTDDGATWMTRREGIASYQFYDICVAQSDPTFGMGGTQDNGIPGRTGFDEWFESTIVVDGMVCNIDPVNESTVYAEWQNGGHLKSFNGGLNWFSTMNGITGNGIWVTPVDQDQNDGNHLYTMTTNGIFRTTNGAASWINVAPHFARWISISPIDGDLVWTMSNFSSVWHTTDDGTSWTFSSAFPSTGTETKIHAHPTDTESAFVTYGGFATGSPHVVATTNRGLSWFDVTGDFPDIPANTFIVDPGDPDSWFIGSDLGVWKSEDGGLTWVPFGTGLPNAIVTDLEIQRETRKLVAGTYGRGMWEVQLDDAPSSVEDGGPPESPLVSSNLMLDPPYPNPVTDSATLRFAARSSEEVSLTVYDPAGREVSRRDGLPGDGTVRAVNWARGEVAAGVYFAALRAGSEQVVRKLVVR